MFPRRKLKPSIRGGSDWLITRTAAVVNGWNVNVIPAAGVTATKMMMMMRLGLRCHGNDNDINLPWTDVTSCLMLSRRRRLIKSCRAFRCSNPRVFAYFDWISTLDGSTQLIRGQMNRSVSRSSVELKRNRWIDRRHDNNGKLYKRPRRRLHGDRWRTLRATLRGILRDYVPWFFRESGDGWLTAESRVK